MHESISGNGPGGAKYTQFTSQAGQDRWIVEDVYHGKRGGFFVDVGAYDGLEASNTAVPERELLPTLFRAQTT